MFGRATIRLGIGPHSSIRLLYYRTVVLSVLSVCLSVTLVYCGQTVRWIKTKPGVEICLSLGHIELDGEPSPTIKGAQPPPFSP